MIDAYSTPEKIKKYFKLFKIYSIDDAASTHKKLSGVFDEILNER